ncbi:MAG: isoleucine--tRNA ligase, partial [Myxococcales bacterium]|nr:isoleucine--tRNA ligase [Myxococcales bacterium]
WFIRTTEVIERTKANNQAINWIPEHIKDGRFGDFLNNNVDWALSRERYWGTPLNIWECSSCNQRVAPASAKEIEDRNPDAFAAFAEARKADPELSEHLAVHKPWVDAVTMPCDACAGTMHRVPEVIDCWFDSGCMPFAQWGWPHQRKEEFERSFPADFISEAIDQTRGWFYSLLMISSLLFEDEHPHPFKNCIVLGHVCDSKGRKESKSKGNYTPPDGVLAEAGADAMRWHFCASSPPYSNTRYSAESVRQGQQEFLLKLRNVYSFFVIYANIDGFDPSQCPKVPGTERALLDRWILSEANLAIEEVTESLDDYAVYNAAQRIIRLTDAVSNWYVRRSRSRYWASDKDQDKWDAYHTLHEVLLQIVTMSAPFVPYLTEEIYQNLGRSFDGEAADSIHMQDWPEVDTALIDRPLCEEMQAVRDIVSLGLSTRAIHKIKVRQPLAEAEVILGKASLAQRLLPYSDLIAEELNVKAVHFIEDAGDRVQYTVKPNYRALGPRFGKRMPIVRAAVDKADPNELRMALAKEGAYQLELPDGESVTLDPDLVQITVETEEGFAASGGSVGVVVLNTTLTSSLEEEGLAREVINRIQTLRKRENLEYTARIQVHLSGSERVIAAAQGFREVIMADTLATELTTGDTPGDGVQNECEIEGEKAVISMLTTG